MAVSKVLVEVIRDFQECSDRFNGCSGVIEVLKIDSFKGSREIIGVFKSAGVA